MEQVRVDKWLWAVRIYKTRSDAASACRASAVRINGAIAKPATQLRIGDSVSARNKAITRTLRVVGITEKRVSASLTDQYIEDQTPQLEYDLAAEKRANARLFKHQGGGRPTKKDRRTIQQLLGPEQD
ncbi:MAG: RNA-binding S4 domain-containing protein [Verrucomicrobiota bacterium]|mgnify:FL=1|nr:RNA-binding S4 domain-containing protein [Verrucomicrobiota bacterium]